jgi:hypothetical protein
MIQTRRGEGARNRRSLNWGLVMISALACAGCVVAIPEEDLDSGVGDPRPDLRYLEERGNDP